MNQPNQPTPKSAEEVLREIVPKDCIWEYMNNFTNVPMSYILEAMQNYASQFARYVPDEEIDAMYSYDDTELNRVVLLQRRAAKAMRDKIFNNVKPKV